MKIVVIVLVAVIGLTSAQIRPLYTVVRNVNDGRYSGGDDGQYHPDNSGAYTGDGSGAYTGTYDKYKHQKDVFGGSGGSGGGGGGAGGAGGYGGSGAGGGAGGFGSGRFTSAAGKRPVNIFITGNSDGSGSGFGYSGTPKQGSAAGLYDNRNYAIIRKVEHVDEDGYHYNYETENKILAEEQGKLANKGQKDEAMRAGGFYEYTGPDSVIYRVDYTADENGFNPAAAHLPTPPPIPEAIQRSLEYQRSIGVL